MNLETRYPNGMPCWIDLGTDDLDQAASFYSELYGWSAAPSDNPDMNDDYREARLDGKAVCGIAPLVSEGQPPAWTTYFAVDDLDATVSSVRQAGGNVIVEPMDVLDFGSLAIVADPTGAVFGLWKSGAHTGADITKELGSMSWNELDTHDPAAAAEFYSTVFGWQFEPGDGPAGQSYSLIKLGDRDVGGMLDLRSRPELAEVPPNWLVYFKVPDVDVAAARVQERGGSVAVGPIDIPSARFAVITDPAGAYSAVIQERAS